MQKLSGLILEPLDDTKGAVLKSLYSSAAEVPEQIKQADARIFDTEYRATLPDTLFALVLQDGDVTLRKYACLDRGTTDLNIKYFLKTAGCLPREAQKTTARNLCVACDWYGLKPPQQLAKVAFGSLALLNTAISAPHALRQAKQNLQVAKNSQGTVNPQVISSYRLRANGQVHE